MGGLTVKLRGVQADIRGGEVASPVPIADAIASINEAVSRQRPPSRKSCTFCFCASSPSPEAPCLRC